MIKTFRGKIADAAQDTVVLHTNNGSTGYRIVKFQVMAPSVNVNVESVVQVFSVFQTAGADSDINFSNQELLAVGLITQSSSAQLYPDDVSIVFDRMVFNQDIFITCKGVDYLVPVNYYIELEQVKLDLSENTVATLKDIRNVSRIPLG